MPRNKAGHLALATLKLLFAKIGVFAVFCTVYGWVNGVWLLRETALFFHNVVRYGGNGVTTRHQDG